MHSRPGAPLWLHRQPDRLTAMFPVYLHGSDDDPLLSAFIQVLLRSSQQAPYAYICVPCMP